MRPSVDSGTSTRRWSTALVAPSLAVAGALALVFVAASGSVKLLAAAVAGSLFVLAGLLSGNPRLFCLWSLMLAVPFDLSKRFGTIIAKMGGETSLRAEFSDVFLLALLVFLVHDLWTGRLPAVRLPKVLLWWLAILGMGVAAVFFGTYRLTAAHEVVRMAKVTLLFLVVCNELRTMPRVLHAAAALSLGVLLQSLVGLYQYATQAHLGLDILGETGSGTLSQLASDSVRTSGVFRAGAFLNHPNIFGAFLAALLPLALAGFMLKVGQGFKLLFLAAAVLGTAALMTSLSRSGWLSFAVATVTLIGLMLLHGRLRRKALLPAAGAAAVMLVILLAFAGPIMERLFESKPDAVLGRAEYNRTAYGVIEAKPLLGWGLNSYVYVAPPYTRYGPRKAHKVYENWLPPVHNIYLLWWAETGAVGLLLHLGLLAAVLRTALRNLKVRDETLFMINVACLCGVLALMVDGLFSFTLRINSVLRVFWVLAAVIFAIHYQRLRQPPGAPKVG